MSALHSLEYEADLLGLVCAKRDRLSRCAQRLVPGFDGIGAGRQAAQIEAAIFTSHREIRMFEYRDVTVHPGMHVALHWNGDLFPRKRLVHARSGWLGLVPFAIVCGCGMDVVRRGIVVHHV